MKSSANIRLVVVDDERPARRKVIRFLEGEPDIDVVAEAANGNEAVEVIQREKPDVVLLDIQMPGLDGFGVVYALDLQSMPEFVFVTAYDQFALRAFEVNALDYLLKPFDLDQFKKVIERVRKRLAQAKTGELSERLSNLLAELQGKSRFAERIFISSGERALLLQVDRINWIEAVKNYVRVYAGNDDTYLVRGTLEGLNRKLDPKKFLRVNRSRIINVEFIKELQPWFHGEYRIILKNGIEMTWKRRYLHKTSEVIIHKF